MNGCVGRREFGRIYFLILVMLCGFLSSTLFFLGFSCLVQPSALSVQPKVNPKTLYFDGTTETQNSESYNDWKSDQLSPNRFRELSLGRHLEPDGGKRRLHNKKGLIEPRDYPDDQDYFGGPPQPNQKLLSKEHSHRKGYRTVDKNILTKSGRGASKKLPQAIIIGVKKGGTRALLEFLRIHPDVRGPGPESHFFDRHYNRGIEWYRKQMPLTLEGQLTMEKTPSYFVTKVVPQRIYNMSRSVKLIMVVRDPVTRAISDYTQAVTKRPDIKSFEQMAFLDNHTGLVDTSWGAIRIGVYAKHLERWLKFFPLKQIHFVNGEKLISNPAGELAKVQDFLGLKRVITDKHFYFNITKGFPCLKKPEGSGNPHCLGKTKGRPHPIIEERVIKRLRDFFRPFNQKFYQLTRVNFEWP